METSKREIVKKLSNKKIVLGNGFDLFCGLKTSYNDFFKSQSENYRCFESLVSSFHPTTLGRGYSFDMLTNINKVITNTIWDLIFYLSSQKKTEIDWCNVELIISNTFLNIGSIKWNNILNIIQKKVIMSMNDHKYEYICAKFLECKYPINNLITEKEFYDLIYKELNIFECKFGKYIKNQQEQNEEYINKAINTFSKFTNYAKQIVSIDTFNYSNISKHPKWCFVPMININGTVDSPIFGYFSSSIDPLKYEHRFTKSHRKTLVLFEKEELLEGEPFENLIVFGHSLNEQDYNYFFPLFDDLDLNNPKCSGKLIIAFTIYDSSKKNEIIENLTKKLIKMIYEYEKSSGSMGNRLYDKLLYKNRIIFYEIDDTEEDISEYFDKHCFVFNDKTNTFDDF